MNVLRNLLIALALLWAIPVDAASRFGVCAVTCTWDSSSTAMWSTSTGGATGASVPGASDTVTFDGATCVGGVTCTITISAATNPTIQSFVWNACTGATTGCIIDNSANNNFTLTGNANIWFDGSGTGMRTFIGGSGTYTVSGNFGGFNAWVLTNSTNLSNPSTAFSSATIVVSGTGTSTGGVLLGTLTFGTITLSTNSNKGGYQIFGGATVGTLNIPAPNYVAFANSNTVTITNAFSWAGTSTNRIAIVSTSPALPATIAINSGTATLDWGILRNVVTSGGTARNATNTIDLGGNTWSSITAPPASSGAKIICGSLQPRKLTWNDPWWKKCAA